MMGITRIFARTYMKYLSNSSQSVLLKTSVRESNHYSRLNNFCGRYTIYRAQTRCLCTNRGLVLPCWKCEHSYPVHMSGETQFFCPSCKVVQQPQNERTYFDIMDCEQTFDMDTKVLTNNFRKLQSQLHPDKFTLKSETEQTYSSLHSSTVNEAYQTLLKPLSRGLYLLNIKGLMVEEATISIDIDFLTNIMEMNETLASGSEIELNKLKCLNKENLEWCINKASEAFRDNDLITAKDVLLKMKYYDNINEQIKENFMG